MTRLAIVVSHPIQYYAPVFKLLSERTNGKIKVFYTWGNESVTKFDPGFGKDIKWDIPLLEGYDYTFLKNKSAKPGSHHFNGIINPSAIDEINDYNPDVILVYGWAYNSHLKILKHFGGKTPLWFRGDSTLLNDRNKVKKFFRFVLLRWVYRKIDKAFYVGSQNKLYFQRFGFRNDQLCFAPHAVDNERFVASRKDEAIKLRSRSGIPDNGVVILYAGKFDDTKNPFALLSAFSKIKSESTYLLFVGNGVLERHLKDESKKISNSERVIFLDFQNQLQMPVIYQASNLFCLPSKNPGDTWGLAVNEAMAAGNAILVSDRVGCGVDLVKDGINGSIFQSGNLEDLTDKLENLVSNPPRLTEMGARSREIIKPWSFELQVEAIVAELDKI